MLRPKLMYLTKRRPGLTRLEFTPRWRQHGALGMSLPRWRNIWRYTHNDIVEFPPAELGATGDYDGVGVVWHRSPEARARHILDTTSKSAMEQDEFETFAEPIANVMFIGLETTLVAPAPQARIKVISFLFPRPDASHAGFATILRDAAEAHMRNAEWAAGCAVTLPLPPERGDAWGLAAGGVIETWFISVDDAVRLHGAADREAPALAELTDRRITVLARETVLHHRDAEPPEVAA